MNSFNLNELVTDTMNVIEIYLGTSTENDICLKDDYLNKIRRRFKLTKETTYVYYNKNNLTYVYDLSNDAQFVYLRKLENFSKLLINNHYLYVMAFNEMKMQTHSFPCSNDIDNKIRSKIEEFKINNRISLIIKNNNLFITYKHSKDVDIEKMNEIILGIIKKMI